MSQKDLAEALDVDPSYVSRLESGEREPSISLLRKLADALSVPSGLLLAVALWSDMPSGQQEKYRKLVSELVNLSTLHQLSMPVDEDHES